MVGRRHIQPTVARRSVAVAVAMSSDRKTSRETSDDRRGDVSTSSSSSSHRSHPRGLGVEETTESADRSSARVDGGAHELEGDEDGREDVRAARRG